MPIANCIISPECKRNTDRPKSLIELWSSEAKISSEHMTINLTQSSEQLGKKYQVMATLLLPSAWSLTDISSLQIGLAVALGEYFHLHINEVFVSTTIVNSGMVVETGKEVVW